MVNKWGIVFHSSLGRQDAGYCRAGLPNWREQSRMLAGSAGVVRVQIDHCEHPGLVWAGRKHAL